MQFYLISITHAYNTFRQNHDNIFSRVDKIADRVADDEAAGLDEEAAGLVAATVTIPTNSLFCL
jgi:hypothetical protein